MKRQVDKEAVNEKPEKSLTKKEVQTFRLILLEKLKQVEAVVERVLSGTLASDLGDMAQQEMEVREDLRGKEIARREIIRIRQALARMSEGVFGICEDCGEQIPRKRLECQPTAKCCLECTKAREEEANRHRVRGRALVFSEV